MPRRPPDATAPQAPAAASRLPVLPASSAAAYLARTTPASYLLAAAREDHGLAARLLALPASERQARVGRDPRFQRQTLATWFVLQAEGALFDPRADPGEAAELAVAIALALGGAAQGKARNTAALGYWLLGRALLRKARWRQAEQAFHCIFALLPDRAASEERGLALDGLAQLHGDLGEVDAATAFFLEAAHVFSQLDAPRPAAACQAELGLLLLESGDLLAAAHSLRTALVLLGADDALAPSLAARMWLGLAEIEAVAGDAGLAREHCDRARALYELAPSPSEEIERSWREARIAYAAEQDAEAEAMFDRVRRELLARGSLAEAAHATWDLVLLRLEAGRWEAIEELAAALREGFGPAGEPWAREMGELARLAAGGGAQSFYRACHDFRRTLRQRCPAAPGRPDLLTPTRALADRLLRHRGEHEDPLGAAPGL
jgi:tetratricopeptide (TPR) repeat protein